MSWGGNGGFFGPSAHVRPTTGSAIMADPGPNATAAIAPPATLDDLRDIARDAYAKGRLVDAAEAQSAVLAMVRTTGTPTADDFLFAGLIHHAARRIADSVEVLRDGLRLFPENASLHENLAVLLLAARDIAGSIAACQTALALGSDSANVHDCLCDAYHRAGRRDLAVAAGRMALESKDRRFGAAAPLVAIPAGLPPAFNPGHPEQNVIAYTLWGNQPRYHVPLLENARIRPHLFPEWTLRVYHDHTVDPTYLAQLAAQGVQLRRAFPPIAACSGVSR
jgi:tetratricopeptide (TPR) repeat protein